MTPNEFKAWFDGFTEAFDKAPSQKQWARIKERVAEIDGKSVTEKVFVDRYWPQYIRHPYYSNWWPYYNGYPAGSLSGIGAAYQNALQNQTAQSVGGQMSGLNTAYNSGQAMNALGRAEGQLFS